jgi:eukaryotic-like serine/threonine-protein kinase
MPSDPHPAPPEQGPAIETSTWESSAATGRSDATASGLPQPEGPAGRPPPGATLTVGQLDDCSAMDWSDRDDPDLYSGRQLGHFRLEQRLASGGMGAVYRALDTSLQRLVAVKVIRQPSGQSGPHAETVRLRTENLLQEAIAQARLNHPNVVTIYFVGYDQQEAFLAMELIGGPTVADKLQVGRLPFAQVVRIGRQVVEALEHAQQFGIVHGDIKPSNLLLKSSEHVKISDFGLARLSDEGVNPQGIAGTPAYLAPELSKGFGPTPQSDMYALGVTLFEMTFGYAPFDVPRSGAQQIMEAHRDGQIAFPQPWPKDVPKEWRDLLLRLLAKKPEERFPTYVPLARELRRLEPVTSTTAALAPRAMAFATDQLAILVAFLPFALAILALNFNPRLEGYRILVPLVALGSLIVPMLSLLWTSWQRRGLGHYLFQLRVVDSYGLELPKDQRLTRSVLRNQFAWLLPLATLVGLFSTFVDTAIAVFLVLFLLLDVLFALLSTDRRSLHDWLCRSRVVLAISGSRELQ